MRKGYCKFYVKTCKMAKNEYTKLDFTNDLNVNFDILISN